MLDQPGASSFHQIATPAADVGFIIQLNDLFNEIAAMQISGSFSCYNIILHKTLGDLGTIESLYTDGRVKVDLSA